MKSIPKVASASLIGLLFALAPSVAMASKTQTFARSRDVVYHDRTPHVHDGAQKQHHHHTSKAQ